MIKRTEAAANHRKLETIFLPQDADSSATGDPFIVSSSVARVVRRFGEPLTEEQRRELTAVAAYYLAERRNFAPGHEEEDWLAAEFELGHWNAMP